MDHTIDGRNPPFEELATREVIAAEDMNFD